MAIVFRRRESPYSITTFLVHVPFLETKMTCRISDPLRDVRKSEVLRAFFAKACQLIVVVGLW